MAQALSSVRAQHLWMAARDLPGAHLGVLGKGGCQPSPAPACSETRQERGRDMNTLTMDFGRMILKNFQDLWRETQMHWGMLLPQKMQGVLTLKRSTTLPELGATPLILSWCNIIIWQHWKENKTVKREPRDLQCRKMCRVGSPPVAQVVQFKIWLEGKKMLCFQC